MSVTSLLAPTTNPANWGTGIANPTNVYVDDTNYAVQTDVTSTSDFSGFGDFGIPDGVTIKGIEVLLKGKYTGTGVNHDPMIELYSTSYGDWSDFRFDSYPNTTDSTITLGAPNDLWGVTWIISDFANNTFKIELSCASLSVTSVDTNFIQVRVTYAIVPRRNFPLWI